MKKIKLSRLLAALNRAKQVRQEWWDDSIANGRTAFDPWMTDLIEIAMLPEVWTLIEKSMAKDGHCCFYDKPKRVFANDLTGYVLAYKGQEYGWNGLPTERNRFSHSPRSCFDGLRRNVYSRVLDYLRNVALRDLGQIEYTLSESWREAEERQHQAIVVNDIAALAAAYAERKGRFFVSHVAA